MLDCISVCFVNVILANVNQNHTKLTVVKL